MSNSSRLLSTLLASLIGIAVMVVIATVVFYITVFVVSTGSSLAGIDPSDDFVVLAAAFIVMAVILTGGLTPRLSQQTVEESPQTHDDPAYN